MFYFCLFIFVYFYFLSAPLRSNGADYVLLLFILFLFIFYRQPCVATQAADYVLPLFILFFFFFFFFIHCSFSETTRPILTKFSGIVYSGVV